MAKIEPVLDKYGTLARATFFADFMEVIAMRDRRAKLSSLRDLIADAYPSVRKILMEPDEVDGDWEPTDMADEAWTCLLERADVLGDSYPFEVSDVAVKLRAGVDVLQSKYVAVLAITVSHAFRLLGTNVVEHLFEDVVADAMEGVGLDVGRLGPLSRQNGTNFERSMEEMGRRMGVAVNPNATARRANANDEDVDLVGHLNWKVSSGGKWMFVCQVTCAVSDDWRKKASEPAALDWKDFFGEVVSPMPFLAVPHHANEPLLRYVTRAEVNVLDRPRLVLNLPEPTAQQREVIQALLDAEYQSFKV